MNRDLKASERKLLLNISAKLKYQNRIVRKLKATDRSVLAWCHEQDLLAASMAQAVEYGYTPALIQDIEKRLAQMGLAPLEADLTGSTLAQASLGAAEHKSVRSKPREHRLLRAEGRYVLDQDWRELELDRFSEIIVVENLDCFYELERFRLPLLPSSLVIYRGDELYAKASAQVLQRWQQGRYGAQKYFGDLDVKGLHIALSEGFTHVAVPSLECFVERATAQAYSSKQHSLAAKLHASTELHPYLDFIQRQQRALLQQWLQNLELHWACI